MSHKHILSKLPFQRRELSSLWELFKPNLRLLWCKLDGVYYAVYLLPGKIERGENGEGFSNLQTFWMISYRITKLDESMFEINSSSFYEKSQSLSAFTDFAFSSMNSVGVLLCVSVCSAPGFRFKLSTFIKQVGRKQRWRTTPWRSRPWWRFSALIKLTGNKDSQLLSTGCFQTQPVPVCAFKITRRHGLRPHNLRFHIV